MIEEQEFAPFGKSFSEPGMNVTPTGPGKFGNDQGKSTVVNRK